VWPQERTLTRPPPKPTTLTSSLLKLFSECYDSVQGVISGSDICHLWPWKSIPSLYHHIYYL